MKFIRKMSPKTVLKLVGTLKEMCDDDLDPILLAKQIIKKGWVRISEDYSNYEDGKSSDGGKYGFWENVRLYYDKGRFYLEITHHTTCDGFDYCLNCGTFNSHNYEECEPTQVLI